MLVGKKVSKSFGAIKAIVNVDFEVQDGEIVGLIGPNGSGKTTLFNLISGVYRPDSGSIFYRDSEITGLQPHIISSLGIARTYQVVRPFQSMRTIDNVATGALYGRGKIKDVRRAKEEARRWLEFTGMMDKSDIMVSSLTLADKKRLEVARALAMKPSILLLDEVFAGLNPTETENAMKLVKRIPEEFDIAILIVEHVMRAVMGVSDRVMVLDFGYKIAEGKPDEIANSEKVIKAYLGEEFEIT